MSTIKVITQQQVRRLTDDLTRLIDTMAATGNPAMDTIDRATVMLESLRLGFSTIEPPIWIGIDLAKPGADQTTYWSDSHAH